MLGRVGGVDPRLEVNRRQTAEGLLATPAVVGGLSIHDTIAARGSARVAERRQ